MGEQTNTPERWVADLKAAGWIEVRRHVWQAPCGALLRGPYGAWRALQDHPDLLNSVDGVNRIARVGE